MESGEAVAGDSSAPIPLSLSLFRPFPLLIHRSTMAFDPNAAFKLSSTSTKPYHHRRIPCLPVCVAVGLVCILVFILVSTRSAPSQLRFGIVIDGGSSGSRIHVYGWRIGEEMVPEIDFAASGEMKVNPGLSAYAQEPERAGESLAGLLEFGKGHVPRDLWGETEVRLMVTAGLRMVESETRERILESCRRVLRASGFRFRDDWATVIPGKWFMFFIFFSYFGGIPLICSCEKSKLLFSSRVR